MEQVKKSNLFPPLVKPEIKKRQTNNWKLSTEGQQVMSELERRSRYYRQMRNKICGGLYESGIVTTQDKELNPEKEEFCIACDQRSLRQPAKRRCIDEIDDQLVVEGENLRHCLCILCKKVLRSTTQGFSKQHSSVTPNTFPSVKKELVTLEGQSSFHRDNYYRWYTSRHQALLKDFRVSALDYDSRLASPQNRPEIEHQMPPKDVMMRSERKCQNWLLQNQDHFKRH